MWGYEMICRGNAYLRKVFKFSHRSFKILKTQTLAQFQVFLAGHMVMQISFFLNLMFRCCCFFPRVILNSISDYGRLRREVTTPADPVS